MTSAKPLKNKKPIKEGKPNSEVLKLIAFGHRHLANSILTHHPDALLHKSEVQDYSGRIFRDITAYEYAYWAKDTHGRRILESHMDDEAKGLMLEACESIEKNGLTYQQHGKLIENSKHYYFTNFIQSLEEYVEGYDLWLDSGNWKAIEAAWRKVGCAQRDVPVHVAHEYCRVDRSFHPLPTFDEDYLPESLTVYNYKTQNEERWFPLEVSESSGLGVSYSIVFAGRGSRQCYVVRGPEEGKSYWDQIGRWLAWRESAGGDVDLAAIKQLDKVRTADLRLSLDYLKS